MVTSALGFQLIPHIHLWCNTYWTPGDQHGSGTVSIILVHKHWWGSRDIRGKYCIEKMKNIWALVDKASKIGVSVILKWIYMGPPIVFKK